MYFGWLRKLGTAAQPVGGDIRGKVLPAVVGNAAEGAASFPIARAAVGASASGCTRHLHDGG